MTNKPEVKRYRLESGHDSVMRKINRMQESEGGVYVRFDDYAALQAEYDRLTRYCKNGLECFANPCERHSGERTPPFSEFFERYGGQCLICVVDNNKTLQAERDQLRAEVEALRKGTARYEAVRKLDPRQFAELWGACLSGDRLFDDSVDDLIDAAMAGKGATK